MSSTVQKLAESLDNPNDFLRRYENLKTRNVQDVDALVCFLSEASAKPEVILNVKLKLN
jgi:hypothetical protein